ncbi:MAG: DNA repair exonuclease [Nitrospinae bacterium]|nr:DNA repair exonuclease [Nitrospinota bacterium]
MFKFIHAADIHLDSPLRGLDQYEGAPVEQIRGATRQALENLVELAIAEQVGFVLIAGDLYDGDWKDYNTGLFFAAQMSKLREAGIRAFLLAGNHDAASQLTKHLRLPDNIKMLSDKQPESVVLDEFGVALHGQGFYRQAVTEDLSAVYPPRVPYLFNIGLLHTSVDGREGHASYAPCSVDGLLSKGYDYWALGHVHKREILHKDPWILFPGNIQGRHVRETGPKGCTLVAVQDGQVLAAEHQDLDVLRWCVCEVDASGAHTGEEVLERVGSALERELAGSAGHPLAVRVRLIGSCRAHSQLSSNVERWTNELRATATDLSSGALWIEKVKVQTRTEADLEEMLGRDDALGGLLRAIRPLDADDQLVMALADEFRDLYRKLPPELRAGEEAIDLESPETLHQAIEDAKHLLLARLLSREEAQ